VCPQHSDAHSPRQKRPRRPSCCRLPQRPIEPRSPASALAFPVCVSFCEAAPRCQYRCSSWVFELFVNR
jgi:hypothetical protein